MKHYVFYNGHWGLGMQVFRSLGAARLFAQTKNGIVVSGNVEE